MAIANKMIRIFSVIFLVLLAGCSSQQSKKMDSELTSQPINKLLIGWDDMIQTIKLHNENIEELEGETFKLKLKLSGKRWELEMFPERSFKVEKESDHTFYVTILDPLPLFDTTGGLVKVKYIWGQLSKGGGNKGYINLSTDLDCLYRLKFFQGDIGLVDFSKLEETFNTNFLISHPELLEIYYKTSSEVVFLRKTVQSDKKVKVRLELRDKKNGNTFTGEEVLIPACFNAHREVKGKDGIYILRDPGQCITHLETKGNKFDISLESEVSIKEFFGNTCHLPVSCELWTSYSYLKGKKVVETENQNYFFNVLPFASAIVNTSWNYNKYKKDFDAKLYSANYLCESCTPKDGVYKKLNIKHLQCEWKK